MRYAVIEGSSVVNVIEVSEGVTLPLSSGQEMVASDIANVGMTYDPTTGLFSPEDGPSLTLADVKRMATEFVDNAAGIERAKYITVAPGQDLTYQEKVRQAQAFVQDEAPNASKYPLIYGEEGITAADAPGVAAVVLQSFSLWQVIGAAIEKVRLSAKRDIASAPDQAAIDAIVAALVWPIVES